MSPVKSLDIYLLSGIAGLRCFKFYVMAAGEGDGAKQLPQVERLSAETWVPAPSTPGGRAVRLAGALAPHPPREATVLPHRRLPYSCLTVPRRHICPCDSPSLIPKYISPQRTEAGFRHSGVRKQQKELLHSSDMNPSVTCLQRNGGPHQDQDA